MSRHRGRDRFRPRELRGVIGTPTIQRTLAEILAVPEWHREAATAPRWDGSCHHGVPWKTCPQCSTPRNKS